MWFVLTNFVVQGCCLVSPELRVCTQLCKSPACVAIWNLCLEHVPNYSRPLSPSSLSTSMTYYSLRAMFLLLHSLPSQLCIRLRNALSPSLGHLCRRVFQNCTPSLAFILGNFLHQAFELHLLLISLSLLLASTTSFVPRFSFGFSLLLSPSLWFSSVLHP